MIAAATFIFISPATPHRWAKIGMVRAHCYNTVDLASRPNGAHGGGCTISQFSLHPLQIVWSCGQCVQKKGKARNAETEYSPASRPASRTDERTGPLEANNLSQSICLVRSLTKPVTHLQIIVQGGLHWLQGKEEVSSSQPFPVDCRLARRGDGDALWRGPGRSDLGGACNRPRFAWWHFNRSRQTAR